MSLSFKTLCPFSRENPGRLYNSLLGVGHVIPTSGPACLSMDQSVGSTLRISDGYAWQNGGTKVAGQLVMGF